MTWFRPRETTRSTPPAGGILPRPLGWILILSLTGVCLAMIGGAWWYYNVQRDEIENATLRGISEVAATKAVQMANWRSERIGDGRTLMSLPVSRVARRVLSSRAPTDADRKDLLDVMQRMSESFLYTDAALVDLDGSVHWRLREESTKAAEFRKSARQALAREADQAVDVVLSDLTVETRTGKPLMSVTAPVKGLGAFILDIDPSQFLFPYLEAWPGESETAESILVRRNGNDVVYLSRRRHAVDSLPFPQRRPLFSIPPDSVLEAGWSARVPDYRGVPALGTVRRIPGSPWYLVCKIDSAEVDAPVRRLGWEMGLFATLIGLSNAFGAVLIWRGQQARSRRDWNAWLYAAANDTPAYLWLTNSAGENTFVNKPLRAFFGVSGDTLPKPWTEYLHPDDLEPVLSGFRTALAKTSRYTGEFRLRRWDGQYRVMISEGVPRFSSSGKFIGYAGSLADVTGRRRAEEQARALSARLITAQEDERTRLARELHDDFNQQIAAVSIAIGNLKRQIPADQAEPRTQIDRIHQRLVQLAESVRRMSHQLHPAILEYQGLPAAVRACCDEFAALTGIRVSMRTEGSFDGVPPSTALGVYRITQEALQNIAKHARSTTAEVELECSDQLLRLTISDSGVGIDIEAAEFSPGLGLTSIKERARLSGGTVDIRSEPNKGTTVTVEIPVHSVQN